MTDAQVAGICAAALAISTGLGKLIWSMFQAWLKERREERTERTAREERTEKLVVAMVGAVATQTARFDAFEKLLGVNVDSVERAADRISAVHDAVMPIDDDEPPPPPPPRAPTHRAATPRGGTPMMREEPFRRGGG